MLGSLSEADDAVQEAWLLLSRSDAAAIENLGGWLTTMVARICLNMRQARKSRREEPVGVHVPDPVVSPLDEVGPEQEALLADSVGLALLVVLHTLSPAERLAFGLHDMFGAVRGDRPDRRPLAGGGEAAGKPRPPPRPGGGAGIRRRPRHAVGARGRVHSRRARGRLRCAGRTARPRRRALRADAGAPPAGMSREVRGAEAVARDALASSPLDLYVSPALINGAAGAVTTRDGKPFSVAGLTVRGGKITEIDILADPKRLRQLDVTILDR